MAQTIIVDISTRGANPVAYTHQGDTGRTFFAEIYENGAKVWIGLTHEIDVLRRNWLLEQLTR